MTPDKPKLLADVLRYDGKKPIAVFQRSFDVSLHEANEVFQETLKWLWLGRAFQLDLALHKPAELAIFPSLLIIDEMWHCFVLCTRDYADFCSRYLGEFIHHSPNVDVSNHDGARNLLLENITYVIDKLGPETAKLWYGFFAIAYGPQWFKEKRKI